MAARSARTRPAPLSGIRLLVLDVDGVMTDGRLHYGSAGEICKSFHVRDGYGLKAVLAAGIAVAVREVCDWLLASRRRSPRR
jgi:3-deoxy-D-manno-octulosonate 8-phosphate phosphatase (KDO 8-P phosphatase)